MTAALTPASPLALPDLLPERLDHIMLVRIADAPRPPTDAVLAASLRPLAPPTYDDARLTQTVADSVARLHAAGALDGSRHAVDGAAGTARALAITGPLSWKRLHERFLPGLALGIAAADSRAHGCLKTRDDWAAATVARALDLWSDGPPPRLNAVCDALVWRTLELPGTPRRCPAELRGHFLRQLLPGQAGPPERLVHRLAAREAGAVRADLRALREALVRRWLCARDWAPRSATAPSPGGDFASAVRAAADRATDGLFGPRKVFISHLWQSMRAHPAFGALTLTDFKRQLVAAHKAGTLTLARADLSAAMDPELLRESETAHLEARYHFVERGGTP